MDPSFIVYFVIALVVAVVTVRRRQKALRSLADDWQRAADEMGLEFRGTSRPRNLLITGSLGVDGCQSVVIDVHTRDSALGNKLFTRVSLGSKGIPSELAARPEPHDAARMEARFFRPLRTFDEQVDSAVALALCSATEPSAQGASALRLAEAQALAAMGSSARAKVVDVVRGEAAVLQRGTFTIDRPGVIRDAGELERLVATLSEAAASLDTSPAVAPRQLSRNVREESDDRVRLRNLEVLLRVFRHSREADEAARQALSDRFAWNRMLGAVYLGEPGYPHVVAEAADVLVDDELRALALQHLKWDEPRGEVTAILIGALALPDSDVRVAALEGLGRMKCVDALPQMRRLVEGADKHVAFELARAAANIASPEAEPLLIDLLAHEHTNTVMTAVEALARMGTARAVEPLRARGRGVRTPGFVKHAIESAVLQIQSRLGDAIAGALSIVEPAEAEGGLSLAREAGQLAMVEVESDAEEHEDEAEQEVAERRSR